MKKTYAVLAFLLAIAAALVLCGCEKTDAQINEPSDNGQPDRPGLNEIPDFDPTAVPETCRSFGDNLLANQVEQNIFEKEYGQSFIRPTFDVEPAAKAAVPEGAMYLGYARVAFEKMYMVFHTYTGYASEIKIPTVAADGVQGYMNLIMPAEYSECLSFRPVRGGSGGGSGECTVIIEMTEKNGIKFLEFDNFSFDANQWQTFRFAKEWTIDELESSQYLEEYPVGGLLS